MSAPSPYTLRYLGDPQVT